MSKAKTRGKVLRAAYKRLEKGWIKRKWWYRNPQTGVTEVCLEGALFGHCNLEEHQMTPAQRGARDLVAEIIQEQFPDRRWSGIPGFNDNQETTKDDVLKVVKLAIIRDETEELLDLYLDDEEIEDLLPAKGEASGS